MKCVILLLVAIPFIIGCSNQSQKDKPDLKFHYACDSGKKFYIKAESDSSAATREKALEYFAKLYGEKPDDCHNI
jgi:hypothetical protein